MFVNSGEASSRLCCGGSFEVCLYLGLASASSLAKGDPTPHSHQPSWAQCPGVCDPKHSRLVLCLLQPRITPATFSTKRLLLFFCFLLYCFRPARGVRAQMPGRPESHTCPYSPTSVQGSRWSRRGVSPSCSLRSSHTGPSLFLDDTASALPPCCHSLFPLHGTLSPQVHGACSLIPSDLCSKVASSERPFPSFFIPSPCLILLHCSCTTY